jgi:hypothetical protein
MEAIVSRTKTIVSVSNTNLLAIDTMLFATKTNVFVAMTNFSEMKSIVFTSNTIVSITKTTVGETMPLLKAHKQACRRGQKNGVRKCVCALQWICYLGNILTCRLGSSCVHESSLFQTGSESFLIPTLKRPLENLSCQSTALEEKTLTDILFPSEL